jgi:hypothetical protein
MVYRHYTDARNRIAALPASLKLARFVLGIDYGFRDETAFSILAWADHDPTVYVLRSWKEEGCIPSRAAEIVKELEHDYRFDRIVADIGGLGKGYAEEAIQRFGVPIEAAEKQNKRGYIDLVNGALARGELVLVGEDCDDLRKEWLELPWHENRQREADGFANHCADATLYGWRACTGFLERAEPAAPAPGTPEAEAQTAMQLREARRREHQRRTDPSGGFARRWPGR